VGVEDPDDLIAVLNWTLHHGGSLSTEEIEAWQRARIAELGL
jgi:hypothetical protein